MPVNFRSKLHQELLKYYFSNPGTEHYVRELSRVLSFDATYISRELGLLTGAGLFISLKRGHEKYFRLNPRHPLYDEFRKITKYIVAKKATSGRGLKKDVRGDKRQKSN
jgi:predicted transcriptional regulator with HTH domain